MQFDVTVSTYEAFSAVGMKVRTDMEHSGQDCPRLWHETFAPRMAELMSGESDSYGISLMVDENHFDYYAALPVSENLPVPQGMERVQVPAGRYAECPIESLEQLSAAYMYIFSNWLPQHPEYSASMHAPSYELYPADHMRTGRLVIRFAIEKV